jgi:cell division protein ZapA (FtsZ GTPase activity inhibitor)
MQYLTLLVSSALVTLAIHVHFELNDLHEKNEALAARHTVQRIRAEFIEHRLDNLESDVQWLRDLAQALEARGRK